MNNLESEPANSQQLKQLNRNLLTQLTIYKTFIIIDNYW